MLIDPLTPMGWLMFDDVDDMSPDRMFDRPDLYEEYWVDGGSVSQDEAPDETRHDDAGGAEAGRPYTMDDYLEETCPPEQRGLDMIEIEEKLMEDPFMEDTDFWWTYDDEDEI